MKLTPEAAEYHYENGAFIVVSDLPEGSQVGIDGEEKVAGQFMGYKMIPSGLHLFTHSSPSTPDAPTAMPVRHGLLRVLRSRQTLVLKYSADEEELIPNLSDAQTGEEIETVLERSHLKTLDGKLGVYPLYRSKRWQGLTGAVATEDVERLVGKAGKLDSLMDSPADDEVAKGQTEIKPTEGVSLLNFVSFDLKRSWAPDAIGTEVTRYSKDKTWLWRDVINRCFGSDPVRLLAQIQLAFVSFLYVHNFAGLLAYKRLLGLCCRCEALFRDLHEPAADGVTLTHESIVKFYSALLETIDVQLQVVPETFFTVELAGTGMEDFWFSEIEALVRNYGTNAAGMEPSVETAISNLKRTASSKFGWEIAEVNALDSDEDEDALEEGEDAPVIVEL